MRSNNICKFSMPSLSDSLSIHCFVLETDSEHLKKPLSLQANRLYLVTQGEGSFLVDSFVCPLHTGSLLFAFEGETVRLPDGKDLQCLYLDFSGNRAQELFRRFGIRADHRILDGFGGLIPLWKEALAISSENAIDLAAEGILLYTLARISTELSSTGGVVSEMIRLTEERFRDFDLSISLLSESLSYHPKYLSHLFKKEMGISYSEYLRNLRINYARGLMDHGLDSVKNVALLSGFSDPLYFSSVFKRVVGISPKEYLLAGRATSEK